MDDELRRKIQRARELGWPEDIIQPLAANYIAMKQNVPAFESTASVSQQFLENATPQALETTVPAKTQRVKGSEYLPMAGAVAGSFVPGLGPIGGGAVGAGIGELARQGLEGEQLDLMKAGKEAGIGLVGGTVGWGAGKIGGYLLRGVGNWAAKEAAGETLRLTGSKVAPAIEKGIDIKGAFLKWAPKLGLSFDDMIGPIAERGKGGAVKTLLTGEEGVIDSVAKTIGKKFRISGKLIKEAVELEAGNIGDELGTGPVKRVALKKIIEQIGEKYKNGKSIIDAREILKAANKKFADTILDTTKDAVAKASQKIEANAIRSALKSKFPQIATALDNEQELLVLRPLLNEARNRAYAEGMTGKLARVSLMNPLSTVNLVLESPLITGVGRKIGETAMKAGAKIPPVAGQVMPRMGQLPSTPGEVQMGGEEKQAQQQEYTGDQGYIHAADGIYSADRTWKWDAVKNDWVQNAGSGQDAQKENLRLAMLNAGSAKDFDLLMKKYKLLGAGEEGQLNVSKVTSQNYSNALSGEDSFAKANELIFKPDGKTLDRNTIIALKTPGTPNQKARQLKAYLYNVADSYLRLRTGAQANPAEIKRLADSLEPGLFDSAETIKTKLGIYDITFNQIINLAKNMDLEETVLQYPNAAME